MAIAPARRPRLTVVLLAVLFALAGVLAAPPAGGVPDPDEAPAEVDRGVEGTRAALVRIEIVSITTIAHINHSTGELDIRQGQYPVPQGQATGVLVTEDGIVATPWRELEADLDRVTVPAANRLFVEELGATLEAGAGSTEPTHATDPDLDMHLQHCYTRVAHCIVVPEVRYDVVLLTNEPRRVRASLVNAPSAPTEVALLRVGGSAMPTARLSESDADPAAGDVVGFDSAPREGVPGWRPSTVPVEVDGTTVTAAAEEDLEVRMREGLVGGPLIDPDSGDVTALTDLDRDTGTVTAVSADAVRSALQEASLSAGPSPFDVAFHNGLGLLNDAQYAAAARQLALAQEYFPSALAAEHQLAAADRARGSGDASSDDAAGGGGGWPWWLWALLGVAALVALLLLWWFVARRRQDGGGEGPRQEPARSPVGSGPAGPGDQRGPPPAAPVVAPGPRPEETPAAVLTASRPSSAEPVRDRADSAAASRSAASPSPESRSVGVPENRPAYCIHCGHPVPAEGRYCGRCGHPVHV